MDHIDGEAVACDDSGIAQFDRIRYRSYDWTVFLYAFDLIELNGDDLRRDPLQVRKATLASTLAKAGPGVRLNEHIEWDDGEIVFRHACRMGSSASPTAIPVWNVGLRWPTRRKRTRHRYKRSRRY